MTAKPSTKESRYRAARLAKGDRLKPVWMTPRTLVQLEQIQGTLPQHYQTLENAVAMMVRDYARRHFHD